MAVIGHEQVEKAVDGFEKVLGLLIAIYYNYQGTSGGLPQEYGLNRLRGGRQPGQGCVAAGAAAMQHFLESWMACQVDEQVSNDRMNQGWLINPSTRLVVEYPGSRDTVSTRPPAASTSSRPATKCAQSAPLISPSGRTPAIDLRRRDSVEKWGRGVG